MDSLPPIPTPASQRWREFRIQVLPAIVFGAAVISSILLWRGYVSPSSIVGQVETNTVVVVTTSAGLLTDLTVERFAEVAAGQPVAQVVIEPQEVIDAELAAIDSDIRVTQANMRLHEVSTLDTGTQLLLNLMAQQTELEVVKIRLDEAVLTYGRTETLVKNNIKTPAELDVIRTTRDSLRVQVSERTKLVAQFEKQLASVQPMLTNAIEGQTSAIETDILKQQEKLRQITKPLVLRAPVDGRVNAVLHHSGERVAAGSALLTITPNKAERVIAWVRQPLNTQPQVGDSVLIRTRTFRRQSAQGQVLKVGSQLENINTLLLPTDRPRPEQGLPIAVSLPPELGLLPGEWVDIRLLKH